MGVTHAAVSGGPPYLCDVLPWTFPASTCCRIASSRRRGKRHHGFGARQHFAAEKQVFVVQPADYLGEGLAGDRLVRPNRGHDDPVEPLVARKRQGDPV